ncbi:hypothetical protein [Psychrobacillus phage Perkons]|nr:hypothetical protein [Psychrobacillus phage Perkons]
MIVDNLICMTGGNTKISLENKIYNDVYFKGTVDEWLDEPILRNSRGTSEVHSLTVVNDTDELVIFIT